MSWSGSQDHEVLPATGLDLRRELEFRLEPGDAVDEPRRGGIGVGAVGTAGDDLASTLALQPVDHRDDHGGVGDEQVVRPRNHRFDGALARVARPVGEALLPGSFSLALAGPLRLGLAFGGAAVDARAARIVDRHRRIDRLVAQPAPPAVDLTDLVEPHDRTVSGTVVAGANG